MKGKEEGGTGFFQGLLRGISRGRGPHRAPSPPVTWPLATSLPWPRNATQTYLLAAHTGTAQTQPQTDYPAHITGFSGGETETDYRHTSHRSHGHRSHHRPATSVLYDSQPPAHSPPSPVLSPRRPVCSTWALATTMGTTDQTILTAIQYTTSHTTSPHTIPPPLMPVSSHHTGLIRWARKPEPSQLKPGVSGEHWVCITRSVWCQWQGCGQLIL